MILRRSVPFLLSVMMLMGAIAGCAAPVATPAPTSTPTEVPSAKEEGEIQRAVNVEADGLALHYLRQSFWRKAKFFEISANKAGFKADFKEQFERRLAENSVSASDYSFSFDSATKSTVVRCDIHDAISGDRGKYTARFEWLELPKGFDLLNFDKISKDKLKGETEINGTPVTLTLSFPAPIGNCHWHVWWSD